MTEKKDFEKENNSGVCLAIYQIHVENIEDGGFIRDLLAPSVQEIVTDLRLSGWKNDSVSFYQFGIL